MELASKVTYKTYDQIFNEISDWIYDQGFKPASLDELCYEHDMVKSFMSIKQRKEAQVLLSLSESFELQHN